MEIVIAYVFALALIAAVVLGVHWCFWALWCWVLPQVYPTGPANLIEPSFWLFVGGCLLLGLIGRTIFGSSKSAEPH